VNSNLQRLLPVILGALIAVTLATLLVRVRYQLEITRETAHLHALLEAFGGEVGAELDRAEGLLTTRGGSNPTSKWHSWELGASGYRDSQDRVPPIAESTLRRALAAPTASSRSTRLLGPFATDRGGNALALARAEQDTQGGAPEWTGEWALVDDVMSHAHVADMMKQGYRLQLYDTAAAAALYQSDDGTLDAPVTVPLRFAGSQLQLRAAPRGGWRVPTPLLSSSLLVLLAVLLWLTYEMRRAQTLRVIASELAEAEARRKDLNLQYGNALESLAALESRLQLVSMYDTVTGLANRSSLIRRIEATLDSMRQSPRGAVCVMAIGFDHMHHITNSFGAEFASRVLVIAAERLEFVLPSKDLLFRTGDFHLAVVLPDTDAARTKELAQKIIDESEAPIALDSHTFMLHPSVGIADTTSGYEYAEALLDHANTALGAVPRDAPCRYCLFDSATAKQSVSRLQLEVDLDRAFAENQFVLEYEPFVAAATGTVAGFEALIRWDHPTEGRLFPGHFVPIALQAGMAHRLNTWVMREAARQAAAWRRIGYHELFVNFNLTAEAFLRPQFADEVGAVLAEFALPGHQLIVELTEATLVHDIRGAARTLQRLGELGVGAWLDDFGTGYSSLSHLRALPLKGVKIDRTFIARIDVDSRDFGFLKALIDLISYLGMQSIIEGVETLGQYELLSLTTCDLYQGYHFSRSMSAAQAESWMNEADRSVKRAITA
jgi:diguanylate cyclase (GGDEF)-like protein